MARAGAVWAGIAALLKRRFGVLEVISTLMLNFIALFAVSYLVRGPLQEPMLTHTRETTDRSPSKQDRLPVVIPGQRLHLGFVVALLLAVTAWWLIWCSTASGIPDPRGRCRGQRLMAVSSGRVNVDRGVFGAFLRERCTRRLGGAVQSHRGDVSNCYDAHLAGLWLLRDRRRAAARAIEPARV